jgi:AcrR family transcriptional regulator
LHYCNNVTIRARLTRAERAATNEQRLLDAALEVFTRHGFHGGTLEQVAAAAGLTTGAVYSRYAGKAELVLRLLERTIEHRIEALRTLRARGVPDATSSWEESWWRGVRERPEWMLLVVEFRAYAARDPELNARYTAVRDRQVRALADALVEDAARMGLRLTEPAEDLARMALALSAGMVLEQWSLGEAFDDSLPVRAAAALAATLMPPSGSRAGDLASGKRGARR